MQIADFYAYVASAMLAAQGQSQPSITTFFRKEKISKRKKETRQQQIKPPQGWLVPVKTVQTKLILVRRRVPNKVIRAHDELIQRATRLYYLKLVPIQRYSSGWQANQEMKKNYPPFS